MHSDGVSYRPASSDTVHLGMASDPTREGLGPTRLPPTSGADHGSRLSPVFLTHERQITVPTTPSLGSIRLLQWLAQRPQRNSLLTRTPAYDKKMPVRGSQMEDMPMARFGEGVRSFRALSK